MNVGELCTRSVISVRGDESLSVAAEKLRRFHVGDLVVIDPGEAHPRPIGILTDRDLAVGVVATAPEHLSDLRCDEVIRRPLLKVGEDDDVFEALEVMKGAQIRRLPVVDESGALVGVLAMDDLLRLFADSLSALASIPRAQRDSEWDERP
ncbi:MAG TPA: CBS domain-containing protein [Deltaproteobacteria bacterium]|nr:CBS domain-containing protein [Deltaproteobacteria bacterium]